MKRLNLSAFLMIELAVALVILSISMAVLCCWYAQASSARSKSLKRLHALTIARSFLDHRFWYNNETPSHGFLIVDDVTINWRIKPENHLRFLFVELEARYENELIELTTGFFDG